MSLVEKERVLVKENLGGGGMDWTRVMKGKTTNYQKKRNPGRAQRNRTPTKVPSINGDIRGDFSCTKKNKACGTGDSAFE